MKMRKLIFCAIVLVMLSTSIMYPVIAEELTETEAVATYYNIPWGNGIDDDHDGVVDDYDEPDVENGTREFNASSTVIDTWYHNFTYPNELEDGVKVSAYMDEIFELSSNDNISVSPTQQCYQVNLSYIYSNFSSYQVVNNVLNVVTFYVNMSSGDIMNGAQEIWYRSPLVWNDDDNQYTAHYLNIYDDDNNLVYASPEYGHSEPKPKFVSDNSSLDGVGGTRVYYKLNMNFRSGIRYRFEEYVKIQNDDPINTVKLYMARGQDIANDGETNTFIFKGTQYARRIPIEASWSAIFVIGIGRAGTEKLVESSSDYNSVHQPTIYTQKISGDSSILNTGSVTLIFPIRTTMPLNISISFRVWSGGSFQNWVSPADPTVGVLRNVTGTIIISLNITDPNASAPNEYQFAFTILNFDVDGEAMTYTMYPEVGALHMIGYGLPYENYTVNHFAVHIELANEKTASVSGETNFTPDNTELLLGIGEMILGLPLSLILPPVNILLYAYGLPSGLYLTFDGMEHVIHGMTGATVDINSVFESGVIRAYKYVVNGVEAVAGGIAKIGAWVVETVTSAFPVLVGILTAIYEFIWFFAFLAILWLWARFLLMMRYIAKGDMERAVSTAKTTAGTVIRYTSPRFYKTKYRRWRR